MASAGTICRSNHVVLTTEGLLLLRLPLTLVAVGLDMVIATMILLVRLTCGIERKMLFGLALGRGWVMLTIAILSS